MASKDNKPSSGEYSGHSSKRQRINSESSDRSTSSERDASSPAVSYFAEQYEFSEDYFEAPVKSDRKTLSAKRSCKRRFAEETSSGGDPSKPKPESPAEEQASDPTLRSPFEKLKALEEENKELKSCLTKLQEILEANDARAKAKQKSQYNAHASSAKDMEPGDQALVLLETPRSKLQRRWQGPVTIVKKLGSEAYEKANGIIRHFKSLLPQQADNDVEALYDKEARRDDKLRSLIQATRHKPREGIDILKFGSYVFRLWKLKEVALVLPAPFRSRAVTAAHLSPRSPTIQHATIPVTVCRLRLHFYWPGLQDDTQLLVNACAACQPKDEPAN